MFFWRDWVEARSYKIGFLMSFANMFIPLAMVFFMGRLFDDVSMGALQDYSGNYVSFVLVGIIVTSFSAIALNVFRSALRRAQLMGTLEVLVSTKTSIPTMMLGWAIYPFFRAIMSLTVMAVGGFLILGVELSNVNIVGTILIILAMVVTMCSVGIIAAGFTLVFKQGDPFTRFIALGVGLLSGMLFPVDLLPTWLQYLAKVIPHTYAIEGMRQAMLSGVSTGELLPILAVLAIYAVILVPISFLIFEFAMVRAKKEGSLAHY